MIDLSILLQQSQLDTTRALLTALDLHVAGEAGHAQRVAVYAVATADRMGMTDTELVDIRNAAVLHDIGKLSIPPELLNSLDKLSEEDFEYLRSHAQAAEQVLKEFPNMKGVVPLIRHHHERVDGTGYPDKLRGEDIPLGARIIAVCEAFDALTNDSPYAEPKTDAQALEELRFCAGTQFDKRVVDAFLDIQPLIQPVAL